MLRCSVAQHAWAGVQAHMEGSAFLTKADLMSQADRSGLATRAGAIYGDISGLRDALPPCDSLSCATGF